MYGSVEARSSAALPSNAINPSFSMMNSASSHFCASAGTISMSLALAHRLVRRHEERVPQLVRHDDRADVLEVAQLDDLLVDRRRRNRIETGGRLVVEQHRRLGRHRARDRDAAALPARQLRRHAVDVLASPTNPSTSSTRRRTSSSGMSVSSYSL